MVLSSSTPVLNTPGMGMVAAVAVGTKNRSKTVVDRNNAVFLISVFMAASSGDKRNFFSLVVGGCYSSAAVCISTSCYVVKPAARGDVQAQTAQPVPNRIAKWRRAPVRV